MNQTNQDAGACAAGDAEINRAIECAPAAVRTLLLQMPARPPGKSRLDRLMYQLDQGIRGREIPQDD